MAKKKNVNLVQHIRTHERVVQEDVLTAVKDGDWKSVVASYGMYGLFLELHPDVIEHLGVARAAQ
jgi:hypothetical protein